MNLQILKNESEELIATVEKYGITISDCKKGGELERAFLIRELFNYIDSLKCCGNCEQLIFGRLCEVNCDERNRKDKCNKWEGLK